MSDTVNQERPTPTGTPRDPKLSYKEPASCERGGRNRGVTEVVSSEPRARKDPTMVLAVVGIVAIVALVSMVALVVVMRLT